MFKKKPTASEVDGVQYRRAKTWQIICYACNALVGMSVYSLIGMASYSASIGYGITTAAVGIILTCTRILDRHDRARPCRFAAFRHGLDHRNHGRGNQPLCLFLAALLSRG